MENPGVRIFHRHILVPSHILVLCVRNVDTCNISLVVEHMVSLSTYINHPGKLGGIEGSGGKKPPSPSMPEACTCVGAWSSTHNAEQPLDNGRVRPARSASLPTGTGDRPNPCTVRPKEQIETTSTLASSRSTREPAFAHLIGFFNSAPLFVLTSLSYREAKHTT
ncbi:uncharacterized protein LOC116160143 [Photinus pyralis]|uniref:uncharacterized protein LOC116160143 n=1 Tax=Photinus pyralis TaxID=7054 RepID=UPI00126743C4|nr:uncharacterized protein LOC116160143 [Photinus pyralis]XP_031329141.1 uncharacterized protein LOC116160143 [Photinus pyralis]